MAEETNGRSVIEPIAELIQRNETSQVQSALKELHAAEIADLVEALPIQQQHALWSFVRPETKGEVLHKLPEEIRKDLIKITDDHELLQAVRGLDTDEIVDLVPDLPKTAVDSLLAGMARRERQLAEQLLSYPEDCAGSVTNTDTLFVVENTSLSSVLDYMRIKKETPEHTDKIIVTDDDNQYTGVLPLSVLLCSRADAQVRDVMDRTFPVIKANMHVNEVAKLFEDHDLISAPVISSNGQLLGRITIDDVVDIIRSQAQQTECAAHGLPMDESLFSPIASSVKRRGLWLGINLATAFLAAWVISLFQESLEQMIVLAILIPIVASMGGIAGGQSLTLIIRGLATEQVGRSNSRPLLLKEGLINQTFLAAQGRAAKSNTLQVLLLSGKRKLCFRFSALWQILDGFVQRFLKELCISLAHGLAWGLTVMLGTVMWFGNIGIGLVIAAALVINFIAAALTGVLAPIALRKIGVDPALAGGVILTTITDVIGIAAFLGLATLLLL